MAADPVAVAPIITPVDSTVAATTPVVVDPTVAAITEVAPVVTAVDPVVATDP